MSRTATLPPLSSFLDRARAEVQAALTDQPETPQIHREEDLRQYLQKTFNVKVPDKRCCSGHVSPWTFFTAAYFAKHPVIVLKGSRGLAGKTFTLGLLSVTEAVVLGADVAILGGSGGQSKRVHKAIEKFWGAPNAPRHLVKGDPGVVKTKFRAGNEIEALTASQNSVRGPHPSRLRLDEVDEMDLNILNAAMGQTMSARGVAAQTVIASTHQHADGTFTEVLKRAAENGWPVMEWCYRETLKPHGWLDQSEVDRKRAEMTAEMWRTEVELQEPSTEGRAIDQDAVEKMFRRELGETDGLAGKVEEFETPEEQLVVNVTARLLQQKMNERPYATGADWGKSAHYSAIPTLRTDCKPARFVVFYRDRKKPYHLMVPRLAERLKRYGGRACHDAHGVGAVIDELLQSEAPIEAYTAWQGASRIALFSEYISAIERGDVVAPLSEPWYRAHKYVTNDDLYGNGHPPDEFIGCALAWRAARMKTAEAPKKTGGVWGGARK